MSKLFGSSGVRGLVNVDLTPALACQIGKATATYAHAKKALVGRDTRTSGQMIEDALISGLIAAGVYIIKVGVVPTPAVAYLTKKIGADIGFMITASHNPPQYNGIKIFSPDSLSYTDEAQAAVENIFAQKNYELSDWKNLGNIRKTNLAYLYSEMVRNSVRLNKRWNVVVDPGCGATCEIAPAIFNGLGCKITALNAQKDGYFPARSSEPTANNLVSLCSTVKALDADIGIAFDGDGDRVAFVDNQGEFADLDRILAAYCGYILKKHGGGSVVTTVEASMCVESMTKKNNGKVIRTKVGDVYISEAIAHHDAVFGGEPCGAWVHPHFHYCPDGPLSGVLLLRALEEEKKSLREFVAEVPEYVTLREKVNCSNDSKHALVSNLEKSLVNNFADHAELSKMDGVRLAMAKGWLLIRASGTEPLIRITVEGESLKAAQDIMQKSIVIVKTEIQEDKVK